MLKNGSSITHRFLQNRFANEFLIILGCVVFLIFLTFMCFIIYHIRNRKSLRRTLLATRILATRGITNLKSVSQP